MVQLKGQGRHVIGQAHGLSRVKLSLLFLSCTPGKHIQLFLPSDLLTAHIVHQQRTNNESSNCDDKGQVAGRRDWVEGTCAMVFMPGQLWRGFCPIKTVVYLCIDCEPLEVVGQTPAAMAWVGIVHDQGQVTTVKLNICRDL